MPITSDKVKHTYRVEKNGDAAEWSFGSPACMLAWIDENVVSRPLPAPPKPARATAH